MSNPPVSYLDASAVLAFLNNEAGRAEDLTALFEEAERGNVRLVTSTITLSEVAYIKASDATSDSEMDARIDDLLVERGIITLIECTEDIARGARRYVRPSAMPDAAPQAARRHSLEFRRRGQRRPFSDLRFRLRRGRCRCRLRDHQARAGPTNAGSARRDGLACRNHRGMRHANTVDGRRRGDARGRRRGRWGDARGALVYTEPLGLDRLRCAPA